MGRFVGLEDGFVGRENWIKSVSIGNSRNLKGFKDILAKVTHILGSVVSQTLEIWSSHFQTALKIKF